jgi:hypothetical protein
MAEQDEAKILSLSPATLTDPEVSPEIWVDRYAKLHGISYHYKTHSVSEAGESLEPGIFVSQMRLFAHKHGLGGIKRMLPDAFLVWRREQAKLYLRSLRVDLKFKAAEVDLVADWVEAATGARNELDVVIMKHFIWQVKRKLFKLPVEFHMMVVAVGKSGGGKSVAVHKFLEPLAEVTSLRDLRIFNDQFARRAFARSYVIFFDELGRSEDADVNLLKNTITAPSVDWRGLGSESVHSAPQNSTFIGCSNSPLRERIKDPTSSRRFWQLDCAERLNWERINSIDYQSLWRSVDENGPCPILPHLDAIRVVQEREIAHKDSIECWLESSCEPQPFDSESPTTDALYSAYADWARMQSMFDLDGFQVFARGLQLRIDQLKWSAGSKRSNRGTIWSLKLKIYEPEPQRRPIGLVSSPSREAVSVATETTETQGDET